jgi:hypothetical protein
MATDFEKALATLAGGGVEFIVIGGCGRVAGDPGKTETNAR